MMLTVNSDEIFTKFKHIYKRGEPQSNDFILIK